MLTCVCIITISQLSSSWNLPCVFQRWQWPSPVLIVSPTEGWPGWVAKFCGHGCEFIVKCCCSEVNKVRCLWASCFCLLGVPLLTNLLVATGNYSATSNNMKLVHWPLMDGLLHLVPQGGDWAPRPLLAVPNVTAHPSTASVPTTILLYNGPLLCDFKWLRNGKECIRNVSREISCGMCNVCTQLVCIAAQEIHSSFSQDSQRIIVSIFILGFSSKSPRQQHLCGWRRRWNWPGVWWGRNDVLSVSQYHKTDLFMLVPCPRHSLRWP